LLLSPEISQEKIREGILTTIKKEVDGKSYKAWLEENPERKLLKNRIQAIKQAGIIDITISSQLSNEIEKRFLGQNAMLRPRHQRDIRRLISIIKSFALLNLWSRERKGATITANAEDVDQAFDVWNIISPSQELNLPPYVYRLYEEIIVPVFEEKNENDGFEETSNMGINRAELGARHYRIYGNMIDMTKLRQQILPMLETAGLITQEDDPSDRRQKLIYPTSLPTVSGEQGNSESEGGVVEDDDIPF